MQCTDELMSILGIRRFLDEDQSVGTVFWSRLEHGARCYQRAYHSLRLQGDKPVYDSSKDWVNPYSSPPAVPASVDAERERRRLLRAVGQLRAYVAALCENRDRLEVLRALRIHRDCLR